MGRNWKRGFFPLHVISSGRASFAARHDAQQRQPPNPDGGQDHVQNDSDVVMTTKLVSAEEIAQRVLLIINKK